MFDFHTHFIPEDVINWIDDNKTAINATRIEKNPKKEKFLSINEKWAFELKQDFINADLYMKKQQEAAISHSIISPVPQLFLYDFDSDITKEIATVYNNALVSWQRENPEQLSGLATVSLNHPEQAAKDLRDGMNKGLKGAIIGPGVHGKTLSDPFFTPFWEEAQHLKAIIFIHPLLSEDPRLHHHMMPNLVGVPWETTIAATDILLSGMLDTYDQVKILLAHGGGFFPYQIGRLNQGYHQWPHVAENLRKEPSAYVSDFWYDTVLMHPETHRYLNNTAGSDKLVSGSDFPFDLCSWPPLQTSETAAHSLLYTEGT
ncbi:amidohydrolase [Salibacterium salarium]|uniref:Amidohydrolase n=1 Tax=Salibacterium salarium TaxID=284579 RepID=A0A428MTM3_9BACI|nr:amidohydrolase family protein [Salibacterium salarium]RSL29474.1 amidohydrolase [Salibacterium salarium]